MISSSFSAWASSRGTTEVLFARIWDKTVLCCSEESLTSKWVDRELTKVLAKEERLWKERGGERVQVLVPLASDDYLFDGWESGKRTELLSRKVIDFVGSESNSAKFDAALDDVVKALRSDEGARPPAPKPKLV